MAHTLANDFPLRMQRILDLADMAVVRENARRNDALGAMLLKVLAAADPDAELQGILKDAGLFHVRQVRRRQQIERLRLAFGVKREVMKRYLAAAGLVNERD
jgi:hypothetical protein